MKDFVVVKSFNTRLEAQIAKSFLEVNGVKVFVTADDEGGANPFPMAVTSSGAKLYVTKKDAKKALELLKEAENK